VGRAWCEHDSRYLLASALEGARAGTIECVAQVAWLARVLTARAVPINHRVHRVELTATLLRAARLGHITDRAAERMADAASQHPLQHAA
jgi:hypothetical protein